MNLSELKPVPCQITPYHGKPKRGYTVKPEHRPFIAWDGEGQNLQGKGNPQSYVLFGCSTGEYLSSNQHLNTLKILDFIIGVGERNPTAFHVSYSFGYDANMILQSLHEVMLRKLHQTGNISIGRYHVQYRHGKWFSVTRYGPKYDRKHNPSDKVTVKIFDLFGFFVTSFVKAYEDLIGPADKTVIKGKDLRDQFERLSLTEIHDYWSVEIEMLRKLADELRTRLYGAGLRITQWHGPGALASYTLKQHHIKDYMAVCPKPVRDAAKYAYAGGRFERFRMGRIDGPIYSLDINSAYPYGISLLPDLSSCTWIHVNGGSNRVAPFGVYRIRLRNSEPGSLLGRTPGPLFHRNKVGNITFPWFLDGWYWSPEMVNIIRHVPPSMYEIVEGWEVTNYKDVKKPFKWVEDVYALRREWKNPESYNPSQIALKLMLNSLYGKMAQRVGWNEETMKPPPFHQLEWAGWVTSYTRAMLYSVLVRIPWEHLIAVETDGIYTTYDPQLLSIEDSSELGEWEVTVWDEIMYVESGLAWLRKGDEWKEKRRGLDRKTFTLDACTDYLHTLGVDEWKPYQATMTRFITVGAALMSASPFKTQHCVWKTIDREVLPGRNGKRTHVWSKCAACDAGLSAYDMPHDMVIRSPINPHSFPHDIPWEPVEDVDYEWRREKEALGEDYRIQALDNDDWV